MNHEQLKQAAEAALKKWLHPQPVKGLDYPLCYSGRVQRAMEHGSIAMQNQDKEALEKVKAAISGLEKMEDAAKEEARLAVEAYRQATGQTVAIDGCICRYCQSDRSTEAIWNAESRLRAAVHPLLEPTEAGMPLPLVYMRNGNEQGLMSLLTELCNAQADYFDKCNLFQKPLAWGYVLKGV